MNPAIEQTLSPGEIFRQKRESLNLSLEDVAKEIALRPSILQQLENNEFIQKSTPATFIKGYVRSYAKFLHLPDSVWTNISFGETERNDLGKNIRSTRAVNQYASHSRWVGRLTVLVLIIAIGMTGLWWWQNYQQSSQERDNLVQNYVTTNDSAQTNDTANVVNAMPVVAQSVETPVGSELEKTVVEMPSPVMTNESTEKTSTEFPVVTAPVEENTASLPQTAAESTLSENTLSQTEEKTIPDTQSALETPSISPALPASNDDLVIEVVNNSSWISVKDKNRRALAQREVKQGETLTFNGDEFSIIIGAPTNVRITYKGAAYPLKVDGRVAKFKLSQP